MNANPRRLHLIDFALAVLVALSGLCASLGLGVLAPPGATRVAVLALPGAGSAMTAISRSGLPIVQLLWGGALVVVDGAGSPGQMAILRHQAVILLDARRVPGCSPAGNSAVEGGFYEPDA